MKVNYCKIFYDDPFGMTMSAISSTAGTVAKNNYKFNAGTELNETFDINYYETYFRQYDAQLGRFTGVDALAEQTFSWSTYQFGYNNPVVFNDPSGLQADYSGYDWLPETFKTSRRNAYLNNGYIDIITGNENSSDAQYFLQEHFSYIFGGEGTFNTNFNHFRFGWNSKGQMGYWLPFIGKSDRMMGDLKEVVVGVKFEVYLDEGDGGRIDLNIANNWLNGAGYGEVVTGAIQIGMLNYRQSLSIINKIGTFGRFSRIYRTLGMTGKVLGGAGYLGASLSTYLDYKSMKSGEIGAARFWYRTVGTLGSIGASIGIGAVCGGPWGAVGGAFIGGAYWAGEQMYDGYMYWQEQMSINLTNIENGLKNGWVPGR